MTDGCRPAVRLRALTDGSRSNPAGNGPVSSAQLVIFSASGQGDALWSSRRATSLPQPALEPLTRVTRHESGASHPL